MCIDSEGFTHSRFSSSVAPVVDGRGDGHYQRGEAVSSEVIVFTTRRLAFKHLHHENVQLDRLHTEPAEHWQQEEMKKTGQHGTHNLNTQHKPVNTHTHTLVLYDGSWSCFVLSGGIYIYI